MRVFRKLFVDDRNPKAASRAMDFKRSVLDLVADDAKALQKEIAAEDKEKGDVRLDTLEWDFSDGANAVFWQDVSDLLIIGDRPPEEEERPPAACPQ